MALSVAGRLSQCAGHLRAARRDAEATGRTDMARAIADLEHRVMELAGRRVSQIARPPATPRR